MGYNIAITGNYYANNKTSCMGIVVNSDYSHQPILRIQSVGSMTIPHIHAYTII